VLPSLGSLRLREVKPKDLQALVDRLDREGLSASTIDTTITPVKAIYRRARNRGFVSHNPTQGLEKPAVRCKPRRFASPAEAEPCSRSSTVLSARCGRRRSMRAYGAVS
jgi:site-specific recombinase XerD